MADYLHKTREELIDEIETLKQRIHLLSQENAENRNNDREENSFRQLVELLPQTVYETDLAGKIIYANNFAYEMFGLSKDDFEKGVYAVDFIAPEDMQKAVTNFTTALQGGYSSDKEYTAVKKDGTRFSVLIYSALIYKNSTPSGLRGLIIDISAQKKRDEKIQLMNSVIDKVSQPIFWIDSEGTIIYLNRAGYELINENASEITGKKIWEYQKSLSPEKWVSFWDELKTKNRTSSISKITNKNGDELVIENRSNFIKTKSIEFCFTYSIDISEKIKAEEDLRKLSKAIEQSTHSVIITDTKGTIEYINPNFSMVTGYKPEEILGKTLNILKPGYAPKETFKEVWDALNSGNEWRGEFLNKRKNKELYWESVLITPVKNTKGEVKNFLALKVDISDKKEMDLELKRALDRAEESSRLKSSLLANMNHEIRTPLTGILGMAQILNEELSSTFLSQFAQNILISGKRLMTTLNAILDLSELESDNTQVTASEFYLGSQLKYTLGYYIDLAEKKDLYFHFDCNDINIAAYTDQKLCNQIIMNLVDNAVKYTNKGGIEITVDPVEEENDVWVRVSVKDTGIGISQENIEIIFEEFRQISEGLNRTFEGSGLGLALVKKMINLIGGRIEVKSVQGAGSEFIVHFPAVKTQSDVDFETSSTFVTEESSICETELPSILLVEDNEINTAVVVNFLNKYCAIDQAETGEIAVQLAEANKYELILMDINLGSGIDGVEAARQIRNLNGYENIPIVAVTGYAMASDKKKILSQGFDYHIAKPFTKDELIELTSRIIPSAAVEAQNRRECF